MRCRTSAGTRTVASAARTSIAALALSSAMAMPGLADWRAYRRNQCSKSGSPTALGANTPPAVRLTIPPVHLDTMATVVVRIDSADLGAHRVRLRMLTPRGLQPFGSEPEVDVPRFGGVNAEIRLLRGGAPRPSRQGVVVLAETVGEEPASAGAATAVVEVQADPAWMPRLRSPLLALAVLLLAAAGYAEKRRRDRRGRAETAENESPQQRNDIRTHGRRRHVRNLVPDVSAQDRRRPPRMSSPSSVTTCGSIPCPIGDSR